MRCYLHHLPTVLKACVWESAGQFHSQTVSPSFFYTGEGDIPFNFKTLYLHVLALPFIKHFHMFSFLLSAARLSALFCWCRKETLRRVALLLVTQLASPGPEVQAGPDLPQQLPLIDAHRLSPLGLL